MRLKALPIEAAKECECFEDSQLLRETRFLQRNAKILANRLTLTLPGPPQYLHDPCGGLEQSLHDLDRRRLAGPVRPQDAEALALEHFQINSAQRLDRRFPGIRLLQV